jgi:transcriptional regulator with XRE-family HTH domain
MDREHGIRILNNLLQRGMETRSSIAKRLGVHPSQVSRIAAGQFVRLEGHALRVCKLAQSMTEKDQILHNVLPDRIIRLQALLSDLLSKYPEVADGLELLMRSLAEQRKNAES